MIRHTLLLLLLTLATLPMAKATQTEIAEKRLRASVDKVVEVAKFSKDRTALIDGVKPVLEDILSFETMTRRAVGPGWKGFTAEQQKEAVRLFTVLILRTYTAKFTPGESPGVEFKGSTSPSPGRVEISTTSLYRGNRYDVIYRMEDQSGNWTITDVVIEGVSLIANFRGQFEETFQQGGASAVLKALESSIAKSK